MDRTKISLITMVAMIVFLIIANIFQYTQLQALQADLAARIARIAELSTELIEHTALLEEITLEQKQLDDELATQAGLIKDLNDTILKKELAPNAFPTPDQLLSDAMNSAQATPPASSKPAAVPSGGSGSMTEQEQWDAFFKESGVNGGGVSGTTINPADRGALKAHGD